MAEDITLEELCNIVNLTYNPNSFGRDRDNSDTSDDELEVRPVIDFAKIQERIEDSTCKGERIEENIEERIADSIEERTEDSIEERTEDSACIEERIEDNIEGNIEERIADSIEERTEDSIEERTEDSTCIEERIEDNIEGNIEDRIKDNIEERIEENIEERKADYGENIDEDSVTDVDLDNREDPDWQVENEDINNNNTTPEQINEESIEAIGDLQNNRGRKAEPGRWKQNYNKRLRMKGEKYTSKRKSADGVNLTKEPRFMGPRCSSEQCLKTKNKLCSEISEICRQELFDSFWKQLDWKSRKVYVKGLVDVIPVKRKTTGNQNSRRKSSLVYHLKTNEGRKPVCKEMFLSTFGLGEWSVHSWVHKDLAADDNTAEATTETDQIPPKKKRMTPLREKQQKIRDTVQMFLDKLPQVPSHYCRASSSKLYLVPEFTSLSQLYDLYVEDCTEKGVETASRQILSDEFRKKNLSLYQPRKDQCDTCFSYKNGNLTEEEYLLHRNAKDVARQSKQTDKDIGKDENNKTLVITMDMQALLLCPKLEASALYYKTKLGVHNFTIYNMGNSDVICYIWHEGEGGIGSNEFTSCIIDYLKDQDQYDTIILWSDGCGYQNRNVVLGNALLNFAKTNKKTIIQKYLERGHTQMEIDSAHSIIERKLRKREIYCPAEYVTAIQSARKNPSPFQVHYLDHSFFKNYSSLSLFSSLRPGTKVGDPKVNNIRCIRYNIDGTLQYKLNHNEDEWSSYAEIRTCRQSSRSDSVTPSLYQNRLKITNKKWQHLQQIKFVMPKDFHTFYDSLPHE